jgi:tetratricopeptide (TPR) repeat protein
MPDRAIQPPDPVVMLEELLDAAPSERAAVMRRLGGDPPRLVAAAEAIRVLCSRSTERGIDAARLLVEAAAAAAPEAAAARRALARALAWAGRFDEAIEAAEQAVAIADAAGCPEESCRSRLVLMHPLTELGRLGEAVAAGRRAQAVAEAAGRHDLAARADINLGIALRRRDEPLEAVACFRRARPHLLAEPAILASLENSLGEALVELQRFDEADEAFEAARRGFESVGATLQAAIADENLADLAFRHGRLHRAIELFEVARRRLAGEETAMHRARVLAEESDARAMLGLHQSAVDGYAAALPMLDRFGLVLEAARARMGMGSAMRALGRPSDAATALAAASQAFTDLGHATARARCDLIRAALELDAGRADAAGRLVAAAMRHFADRPADVASARLLLGEIAASEGREELATAELAAGLAIARELDLAPMLADLLHAVGRHQRRRGQMLAALSTLTEAAEQVERIRSTLQANRLRAAFLDHRASVHESRLATIIACLADPGTAGHASPADAFAAAELMRHRMLLEEIPGEGVRDLEPQPESEPGDRERSPERRRLERALAEDHRTLNELYSRVGDAMLHGRGHGETAELREAIRRHERSAADHAMRLDSVGGGSLLQSGPVPLETFAASLPADTRAVVFACVEGRLARFVVDPVSGVRFDPAVASIAEVQSLVRRLAFQVDRGLRPAAMDGPRATRLLDDARAAAAALHAAILGDLPATDASVGRLLWVPDGPLSSVPPGVLHDGSHWLAARHSITVAPSAAVHHRLLARGDSRQRIRLVVGVHDDRAPRIAEEAAEIAASLTDSGHPVQALVGSEATRTAVLAAMADAATIHVAAHGRFDRQQPHASGLRLADRWVTVTDLSRLALDADLVTLSGCETGLGGAGDRGGEAVGPALALLAAGARRVVASQWSVDDRITHEVMVRLHQAWSENATAGDSAFDVASALSLVHHEMVERTPHPAHWGGFVLMGRN